MTHEPGLTRREAREIRRALSTDAAMARLLDNLIGPGGWTYDPSEDVWVIPDDQHQGPGRAYTIMKRGGDWFKAVVPEQG